MKAVLKEEGVSIIICCHNSASRIETTLVHIARQVIGHIKCEVVLVDNACQDNTVAVAEETWAKYNPEGITLNTVNEPQPGLSFARAKGISSAAYEYLIFCDDDNWLDEYYVDNVFKLFSENPKVAVIGGSGTAVFEHPESKPFWFDSFYHGYAVELQPREQEEASVGGAGMAVRKSLFESLNAVLPAFLVGRKKDQLSSGEDSELCLQAKLTGNSVLYSPKLKFKHFLPANRLTWNYLKRLHTGFANSNVILSLYETALASSKPSLSPFFWLKKSLYYWGIYLKYWPKHYREYSKGEGTVGEIHHLIWKTIALNYLRYNFKTVKIYREIFSIKKFGTS